MFKNLQNRAKNFLHRIASNPAHSSRAVFTSLMIVSMCALTLDIGPRVTPQYFGARLIEPHTLKAIEAIRKADKINQQTKFDKDEKTELSILETCKDFRENKYSENILNDFETSFAGILPGAGNLLLEHPSTVNNRKEALIFEVMKNYVEKKFCIPQNQFEAIYFSKYKNTIGKLNYFIQVRAVEKFPKKYKITKNNDIFLGFATEEYVLVERDLVSTQKYVEAIVNRAIESAIELDQQTQTRVANLGKQTTNHLLNTIIKQDNEIINVNTSAAVLLEAIRNQDASENLWGMTIKQYMDPKAEIGKNWDPGLPSGSSLLSGKKPLVSFGLLNLVNSQTRSYFLANYYSTEMAFYLAARYSFDPLAPENANAIAAAQGSLKHDQTVYLQQIYALGGKPSSGKSPASRTITARTSGSTASPVGGVGATSNNSSSDNMTPVPVDIRLLNKQPVGNRLKVDIGHGSNGNPTYVQSNNNGN